jgi:hypothetical protein
MAHIVGYMAIGIIALAVFIAVFGLIDVVIQLYKQDKQ